MEPQILQDLLAACRRYTGGAPDEHLREVTGEFLGAATEDPGLAVQATAALPDLGPAGAAWVAVVCGALVEHGVDPAATCAPLLRNLDGWFARLPTEEAVAGDIFPLYSQALVSHLARMPALREQLAADEGLMQRIDEARGFSHGAEWLFETIHRTSGTLTVLHPTSRQGFRLAYVNVASCFHLFTLIQTTIGTQLPGGTTPAPGLAAAARGQSTPETLQGIQVTACWHYGDPTSPVARLETSIWGEAMVRTLPRVDGEQIILLWPSLMVRFWNAGFFGPVIASLPPDMTIERPLTDAECTAWIDRLQINVSAPAAAAQPTAPPRPAANPMPDLLARRTKPTWWQRWFGGRGRF